MPGGAPRNHSTSRKQRGAKCDGEGAPYTVISPDGSWLGHVETPPKLRILDVTGGFVLGVLRDEMDVENVVVYELVGLLYP